MSRATILLAEDHHLVREALRTLIEQGRRFEVVGEARDGHEALALARRLRPQIVVMDIIMPSLNGLEATAQLRALPHPPQIVILSQHNSPEYVAHAVWAGAQAYLLKDSTSSELLSALDAVMAGERYFSAQLPIAEIEERLARPSDQRSELERLTARERQVLQLVAEGNTNRRIAAQLRISIKTVEKHRFSLMEKLGKRDVASLVRFAVAHGVVPADSEGALN